MKILIAVSLYILGGIIFVTKVFNVPNKTEVEQKAEDEFKRSYYELAEISPAFAKLILFGLILLIIIIWPYFFFKALIDAIKEVRKNEHK